jgi:FLVCR family MFS transporter
MSPSEAPLLGGAPRLAPERWYILALYFVLMANQCLFWFTFAADPTTFEAFFPGLTSGAIDQLLNWGPITFVPTVPLVIWLLQQENGLRKCLRLNAALTFAACSIRMIPCLFSHASREKHQGLLLVLHLAQILNGIAGPVLIVAPSRLSAMWFPPGQRTTVTAVANASPVGWAVGFYLIPAVLNNNADNVPVSEPQCSCVANAQPTSHTALIVQALLLLTLGFSVVPLLCVILYCPDHPTSPQSTPGILPRDAGRKEDFSLTKIVKLATSDSRLLILMLVCALSIGIYDGWMGVLPQIMHKELPVRADTVQ